MKKIFIIAMMIFLSVAGGASAYYNSENLPEVMSFADAVDIVSEAEINGGHIISINDEQGVDLTPAQAKELYVKLKNVELARTIVKTPFSGLMLVFDTKDSARAYYLNSGVQIGTYGTDNYVCYIPKSNESFAAEIQSLYHGAEARSAELAFLINKTNDFLKKPSEEWAVSYINDAASKGLVPYSLTNHYNDNITREEFCVLIGNMMAVHKNYKSIVDYMRDSTTVYQKNYFKDCDDADPAVDILHTLGIINGKENNMFMPDAYVTRQEAAKIIAETAEQFGPLYTDKELTYNDKKDISAWAEFYVKWCTQHGIMMGDEFHKFLSETNFTVTEAIVTVIRLYDYLQN